MSKLLLEGGRLVDPCNDTDGRRDLLLDDGVVVAVAEKIDAPDDAQVLDCRGKIVAPGFVDMHVHLREPGFEYKETIASGAAAAAAGGFTAVACMPNTDPVNDERAVTEFIVERASRAGGIAVHPIGAVSLGQRGESLTEIGELVDGGCVAVSDDGYPVASAELMRRALEYTRMFDIPVIEHCEDVSMTGDAVMHEGAVSTILGMRGWPAAAEEIIVARDLLLAEATGGRVHMAHMSTVGSIRMVRDAKARGVNVTCEVCPHHFALTDEAVRGFNTNAKVNPPLRSAEHMEAMIAGIVDGTIDAIATDHAPHHVDEKRLEFDYAPFGIIGLETAVPLACDRLLHAGHVDIRRLVELMSCNPARILRLDGGRLDVGAPAHVTVLDPDVERTVDVATSRSLSRNSPFDGWSLRGWPAMTIVSGRVVWSAGS